MQPFNIPTPNTKIKTVITDENGNPLDTFTWEEKTTIQPDGTISTEKINYGKILGGDTYFDFSMAKGPKPVRLASCYFCRKKNKTGILSLERSRICHNCLRLGCPSHIKRSIDSKYRCKPCNRKYRLKRFIKRIFFYLEEE